MAIQRIIELSILQVLLNIIQLSLKNLTVFLENTQFISGTR